MSGRYERPLVLVIALSLATLAAAGCSRKPKPAPPAPPVETTQTPPSETTPPKESVSDTPAVALGMKDIFFDYDKSILRGDMQEDLAGDGKHLLENSGMQVLLEGHCDERGTVEYNLALGERRAQAVKSYLVQYGIEASRLSTISYGEERPFVQGHDESAWSQNRRVHFVRR
jgi:peptidoglycan-associated lipoprotein